MIRVNEKWNVVWQPGITIQDVLREMGFTTHLLVVSVNGTHVPPEQFDTCTLQDGDNLRAIHIIAGG